MFSQIDLHIPNFYITKPVIEALVYDGVNIKLIDSIDEIYKVDLIPFDGLCLSNFDSDFLRHLRNHENYHTAKKNPSIPLLFFHEMEGLSHDEYYHFILTVKKEFGIDIRKIILFDTNIFDRKGVINPPLKNKIKQFKINTFTRNSEKSKKFTFLNNRCRKLRLQVFDKILCGYENDIEKLKLDNTITFRNFKDRNPSKDISDFKDIIEDSEYYTFHNTFDFYNTIELPWVIDNFRIGDGYLKMHDSMYDIYSQSFFSICIETEWYYYNLELEGTEKSFTTFSEKSILPLAVGNLPFIIHNHYFYKKFEEIGFDFSYLKTLFGINYKTNTLRQNFDQIDNFISYMKTKTLDEIKKDYESLETVIQNNKNILIDIYNNKMDESVKDYILKIKKEKSL